MPERKPERPGNFEVWLEQHLEDAQKEYGRAQELEESGGGDEELYEKVHQMWGYLAGLEKCLKEFRSRDLANRRKP